jgi:5-methylcytosine-specific restriction endonuclease McrA
MGYIKKKVKKSSKFTFKNTKPTVDQLDDLCRTYINLRDKQTCVRCGRKRPQYKTEWSHFYSRSNKAVRWDEDNSVILCFNCHYNFAHKEPKEFHLWYEQYLGTEKLNALTLRKNSKAGDYNLIKLYLQQKIKEVI